MEDSCVAFTMHVISWIRKDYGRFIAKTPVISYRQPASEWRRVYQFDKGS